jgi:hypothetical protein
MTKGLDLKIITDILIEDAIEDAKNCDKKRKEKNFSYPACGILFGLPISFKENF